MVYEQFIAEVEDDLKEGDVLESEDVQSQRKTVLEVEANVMHHMRAPSMYHNDR